MGEKTNEHIFTLFPGKQSSIFLYHGKFSYVRLQYALYFQAGLQPCCTVIHLSLQNLQPDL